MTSPSKAPAKNRFEQTRARLSDSVIGVVVPRRHARDAAALSTAGSSLEARLRGLSTQAAPAATVSSGIATTLGGLAARHSSDETKRRAQSFGHSPLSRPSSFLQVAREAPLPPRPTADEDRRRLEEEEKERLAEIKKATRREQLRVSQARFRQKRRNQRLQQEQKLEQQLQQMREEILCLNLERQSLKLRGKAKPSPWSIASEVLHLIDTCFQSPWCAANAEAMKNHTDTRRSLKLLQTVLVPEVAMGELQGFSVLMEQVRRYSLYFGDPQLQLERIEAVAPCVVRAIATLNVTVTEFTLQCVFPHLLEKRIGERNADEHQALRRQLLGTRLTCNCALTFLFDEESGRVKRLEPTVDLLASLTQALGHVAVVWTVLEKALLTPEGAIGST